MTIERTTNQSAATVAERIEASAKSHGFGVLHAGNVAATPAAAPQFAVLGSGSLLPQEPGIT